MRDADLRFRASYSDWIGSRLIYAPTRKVTDARFVEYLGNALLLKVSNLNFLWQVATQPLYFVSS